MEVGDLVQCKEGYGEFGIGVITMERPFGGFIVWFPASELRCETKTVGLSVTSIEVLDGSR
tara:strand:- start:189 stop:371 length:183 start_codon:yes stop_codon:yes gene_type:complete